MKAPAVRIMVEKAWEAGWWVEEGRKKHIKCYSPDGKGIVVLPSTPSDHRGIKNARSLLRQHGLKF